MHLLGVVVLPVGQGGLRRAREEGLGGQEELTQVRRVQRDDRLKVHRHRHAERLAEVVDLPVVV